MDWNFDFHEFWDTAQVGFHLWDGQRESEFSHTCKQQDFLIRTTLMAEFLFEGKRKEYSIGWNQLVLDRGFYNTLLREFPTVVWCGGTLESWPFSVRDRIDAVERLWVHLFFWADRFCLTCRLRNGRRVRCGGDDTGPATERGLSAARPPLPPTAAGPRPGASAKRPIKLGKINNGRNNRVSRRRHRWNHQKLGKTRYSYRPSM